MPSKPIRSRREAEEAVINKALEDASFRRDLVANPHAAISRLLGFGVSPELKITVLQETPDTAYLVLPVSAASGELSDDQLEGVAGGLGKTGPYPLGVPATRAREAGEVAHDLEKL